MDSTDILRIVTFMNRFALFQLKKNQSRTGITLIEIVVAVSVIVVLGAMAFTTFTGSRNARDLTTGTQDILSVLRLAQSKTLAGQNDSVWGVRLAANQVTLFQGPTYAGAPFTQVYLLPGSLQITDISLAGGGTDVIFKRVTGETDTSGTFTVGLISSSAGALSVTINASGKAYQTTAAATSLISRLTDARHRSFTLGWSIQTATTLTLTFADPATVQNITMSSYFDAGKTKFDWSGTINVGGINQTLRIHTASLTAGDTVLSIDRDCRQNNKELTVAIDAKTIAVYEADCTAVSVGAFGGVISEP